MIPKYHQIIHPLLELISKEVQSRKTASDKLRNNFNMNKSDLEETTTSGMLVFDNRVGWAFTNLFKAEYIELTEQKAIYKISNLGKEALNDCKQKNIKIDVKYLEENSSNFLKNWKISKNDTKKKNDLKFNNGQNEVDFDLEEELDRVEKDFDADLLRKIKDLSWQKFEDLCAELLEKMGYGVASKREIRSGDGGIDGEIYEDELGLKGKIYIQAKKWDNNNVQPKDIKEFLFNVRANKGVFITTSDFSQKARDEAINYKDGKVALINYSELVRLCKKYQILCKKQTIHIYKIKE